MCFLCVSQHTPIGGWKEPDRPPSYRYCACPIDTYGHRHKRVSSVGWLIVPYLRRHLTQNITGIVHYGLLGIILDWSELPPYTIYSSSSRSSAHSVSLRTTVSFPRMLSPDLCSISETTSLCTTKYTERRWTPLALTLVHDKLIGIIIELHHQDTPLGPLPQTRHLQAPSPLRSALSFCAYCLFCPI